MMEPPDHSRFLQPLEPPAVPNPSAICRPGGHIESQLYRLIRSRDELLAQVDRSGAEPVGDQLNRIAGQQLQRDLEAEGGPGQPLEAYVEYLNALPEPVQREILEAVVEAARSELEVGVEIQFGPRALGVQRTTWFQGGTPVQMDLRFVLPESDVPGH